MDRLDATRGRRTIARPGTGERPVGPPDHSPGRNPGAKRHTPPTNRAARPEWMYRPARIRPHRVPAPPPQGFAPIVHTPGFRPDRPHTRGFAPPGFRPGLWSTGPTARPGTGERPVGAPDHSQGRNPWAAKPWAARIQRPPDGANARPRPNSPASADALATQLPGPLGQKCRWQLSCRGRWVKSVAGNSVAEAAGSKVTLATRLPRPLGQK